VSELFDGAARRLLGRAYKSPDHCAATRLADPTSAQRSAVASSYGVDVLAADDAGKGQARTRWARAFVRALYYQHRWYYTRGAQLGATRRTEVSPRPLKITIGRHLPVKGVIPAGRLVVVEVLPGGAAKDRALAAKPATDRYITPAGEPGPAWNEGPESRDWEAAEL
jgi:hypothetical protein